MSARAAQVCSGQHFETIVDDVARRVRDPYGAADELLQA